MGFQGVYIVVGIIGVSFIIGILTYYLLANEDKQMKKKMIDASTSMIINYILYIWLGKIIINIRTVIQDPFAVLAYPSDARAFLIATACVILHSAIWYYRQKLPMALFIQAFSLILLTANGVYGLLINLVDHRPILTFSFVLSIGLILAYVLWHEKWTAQRLNIVMIGVWVITYSVIALINGKVMVYKFYVSPIYLIGLTMLYIGIFIYLIKRSEQEEID